MFSNNAENISPGLLEKRLESKLDVVLAVARLVGERLAGNHSPLVGTYGGARRLTVALEVANVGCVCGELLIRRNVAVVLSDGLGSVHGPLTVVVLVCRVALELSARLVASVAFYCDRWLAALVLVLLGVAGRCVHCAGRCHVDVRLSDGDSVYGVANVVVSFQIGSHELE